MEVEIFLPFRQETNDVEWIVCSPSATEFCLFLLLDQEEVNILKSKIENDRFRKGSTFV